LVRSKLHRYIASVSALRWLFVTKDDKIVIMQAPNVPLSISLLADLGAYLSHGQIHVVLNRIAQIGFIVWAVLEIGWGVNGFRRILGGIVLSLVTFGLWRELR
jgi:hypothetical protein